MGRLQLRLPYYSCLRLWCTTATATAPWRHARADVEHVRAGQASADRLSPSSSRLQASKLLDCSQPLPGSTVGAAGAPAAALLFDPGRGVVRVRRRGVQHERDPLHALRRRRPQARRQRVRALHIRVDVGRYAASCHTVRCLRSSTASRRSPCTRAAASCTGRSATHKAGQKTGRDQPGKDPRGGLDAQHGRRSTRPDGW